MSYSHTELATASERTRNEYKQRVLGAIEACASQDELAQLLLRERLDLSQIAAWRLECTSVPCESVPAGLHRVLQLVASGATNREIACELRLSERTVRRRIDEIEKSLGARNRAQAVALAIKQGLI